MSKNTKSHLIKKLTCKYGENFKSPLSRDLGVNVSTIKRIFNTNKDVPIVYEYAILYIIQDVKKQIKGLPEAG